MHILKIGNKLHVCVWHQNIPYWRFIWISVREIDIKEEKAIMVRSAC
jgi:hypothetical protein